MAKKSKKTSEVQQIGRFGLVGVLNTVIDLVIYNILAGFFGVGVVLAGIISGTVAMINSFIFNQRFTFRAQHTSNRRIVYFFVLTIFGLYVIRPIITHFLTVTWLAPANLAYKITHGIHLPLSEAFVIRNLALGVAILVVLAYNYVTYKKLVFVDEKSSKK